MKQPTREELNLYHLASRGLMTDTQIARALGLKQRQAAAGRMWRIHKLLTKKRKEAK